MSWIFVILGFLFAAVALFMCLLILLQKGRGGGLSSAFGGAGGNTAFGTKTGDVFTWATAITFAFFLLLSMGLVWAQNAAINEANAQPQTDPDALAGDEEGAGPTESMQADSLGADEAMPSISGDATPDAAEPIDDSPGVPNGDPTNPTTSDPDPTTDPDPVGDPAGSAVGNAAGSADPQN